MQIGKQKGQASKTCRRFFVLLKKTCHRIFKERVLFVDRETGSINTGFSVIDL
jgi:hypothetical protein